MAKTSGPAPETLIDLDFGDADFRVEKFPDGMFVVTMPTQLVLSEADMKRFVRAIGVDLGTQTDWVKNEDFGL